LRFAGNDATLVSGMLRRQLEEGKGYREVVPILLTDEQATQKNLRAVFRKLAGREVEADALAGVAGARLLARAAPEDLVVVTYSGHGHADRQGTFFLFPHDIGIGHERVVTPDLLPRLVSG